MNDTYDHYVSKSTPNLKEQFKKFLGVAWELSAKKLPKELAPIIIKQFETIGYDVGIKGLNRFLAEHAGAKTLTTGLIAELGGSPITAAVRFEEVPKLLCRKIIAALCKHGDGRFKESSFINIYKLEVGELGLQVIKNTGGLVELNDRLERPSYAHNLENTCKNVVYENKDHPDIQRLIHGKPLVDKYEAKRITDRLTTKEEESNPHVGITKRWRDGIIAIKEDNQKHG